MQLAPHCRSIGALAGTQRAGSPACSSGAARADRLVVYAQSILENARIYAEDVDDDLLDQIFDCLVRDFSKHALQLYSKPSSSPHQMELCLRMLRKPVVDAGRFNRVWQQVHALKDAYELS